MFNDLRKHCRWKTPVCKCQRTYVLSDVKDIPTEKRWRQYAETVTTVVPDGRISGHCSFHLCALLHFATAGMNSFHKYEKKNPKTPFSLKYVYIEAPGWLSRLELGGLLRVFAQFSGKHLDVLCPLWYPLAVCDYENLFRIKYSWKFSSSVASASVQVFNSHQQVPSCTTELYGISIAMEHSVGKCSSSDQFHRGHQASPSSSASQTTTGGWKNDTGLIEWTWINVNIASSVGLQNTPAEI